MIQRSRTIDVFRRRQILSKRKKRVQMKLRGTEDQQNHKIAGTETSNEDVTLKKSDPKQ